MSKSIRLYALLNKPEQKAVVTIDATATWESLWTSLEKALGASLKEVLSCTAASYTKAPREIKMDNKSATMSQLGLADGMTLKLTAPVKMIRPASIKAKEEKEEEKSDKDASKEEKARARYESAVAKMKLTSENVFKKLAATFKEKEEEEADRQLLNGKGTYDAKKTITLDAKQKTMLQFIDENFGSIVLKEKDSSSSSSSSDEDEDDESKGRLKKIKLDFIPLKMICEIYKRDTLSIENEMTLLQVGLAWADQRIVHLTKAKKAETAEVKSLMQPVLPHIRLTLMTRTQIASSLTTNGLLPTEQILDLITYVTMASVKKCSSSSSSSKSIPLPSSLKHFNNKPRTGSESAFALRWDPENNDNWIISANGSVATTVGSSRYQTIAASKVFKSGVWEIMTEIVDRKNSYISIGVIDNEYHDVKLLRERSKHILDYDHGWGFAASSYGHSSYVNCTAWPSEPTPLNMKFTLDMKKHTLSLNLNGTLVATCTKLPDACIFAYLSYQQSSIKIVSMKKIG
eukprot:TRINITY_DN139_c0_g1_i1.p1 TRINITY_DN139_c0_g1~~TRINITY_DN139_c0_g1_i1.p1  ORF type:complete len:516 (+),score=137.84 TRINITY_DN139_c0_g1_i1:31-1578(+)